MDARNNTIAGWALGAGIVALGSAIVGGILFDSHRPEKMGYPIEGVVAEGGADAGAAPAVPIAALLPKADAAQGFEVFKKCAACHNAAQGGAAGIGPNLYAVVGDAVGQGRGFAFSDALAKVGGKWDFDKLNAWLESPRTFAPGTKMTFAGLSSPQDRANVILYLNQQGSNLPLPAAPAATEAPAGATAATPKNSAVPGSGASAAAGSAAPPSSDIGNHGTPERGAPSVDPQAAIKGARSK